MERKSLLIFVLIFLFSCVREKHSFQPTDDELYKRAEKAVSAGKISKAIRILEEFQVRFPRSPLMPQALVLLGRAYILNKEYILAESKFKQVINYYPESPQVEYAAYLIAKTYILRSPRPELDQEDAALAIESAEDFLLSYPNSIFVDSVKLILAQAKNKLAKKLYLNACLYYRMKDYDSVLLYLDEFMKNYAQTELMPDALLLLAKVHKAKNEHELARKELERIIKEYPQKTKILKEAEKELKKLR
ncbi:MAG: outer membrane protein assembly factor BamD [bacterium]